MKQIYFPLVVRHATAKPLPWSDNGQATARVALLFGDAGRAVVLMVDGNYGASITNAADGIVAYLYRTHFEPEGYALAEVVWLYRDSEGNWDEIVPVAMVSSRCASVNFRPHAGRTLTDVLRRLDAEGVSLSDSEKTLLTENLCGCLVRGAQPCLN